MLQHQEQQVTPTALPPVDPMEEIWTEVLKLLQSKQYELAFTEAVSASTVKMAVFCCEDADLNDVFASNTP